MELKTYIADLFGGPVAVVNREALRPHLRGLAEGDAVYAF
jgi:predicted nucleotidyltransferase